MVTPYQLRYTRCHLVLDDVLTQIMREYMGISGTYPASIEQAIFGNRTFRHSLNQKEMSVIQTLSTDGFKHFDISLMHKIARHESFALLITDKPTRRWTSDPQPNECTVGDNMARIKKRRDELSHVVCSSITEDYFDSLFLVFIDIAQRAEQHLQTKKFEHQILNYKTCTLDKEMEEKYKQQIDNFERKLLETQVKPGFPVKVYIDQSTQTAIEDMRDKGPIEGKMPAKIICSGIANAREQVDVLNSREGELSTESIKFKSAEEGSLLIYVEIDVCLLQDNSLLNREMESFIQNVFEVADLECYSKEQCIVLFSIIEENWESTSDEDSSSEDEPLEDLVLNVEIEKDALVSEEALSQSVEIFLGKVVSRLNGQQKAQQEIKAVLGIHGTESSKGLNINDDEVKNQHSYCSEELEETSDNDTFRGKVKTEENNTILLHGQEWMRKKMADTTSRYFISYSNKPEDYDLVNGVVIPKLREKGISIYEQNELQPGTQVLTSITSLVDKADKTLLFISENYLSSSLCSFELLISLEKSQRTNRLAVVLLLHKIEESQLPHIAVLQDARKIHFDEKNDDWVRDIVEELRETKTIGDIMPTGNVAHGLVWSHYAEFLQYVLPELDKTVKESEWYKNLTEKVREKVSCKLYELVPMTCAVKYDIPKEDDNIKAVTKFQFKVMRGENRRYIDIQMYSITIGQETCYCMCEFPNVIGTIKVMEDIHLARFCHTYIGEVGETGFTTAFQFTTEDKKLQLGRFYYAMNSTLNHFDECKDTVRVLPFNDEKHKISGVLMEAIKKDLNEENFQEKKFQESNQPPQIDRLEYEEDLQYEYQVYVACTDFDEDQQKAQQIMDYLRANGMADSDILDTDSFLPGSTWAHKLNTASRKCRWFIFLLTKNALKDTSLNYNVISALGDSIYRRKVRVIPVIDRCDHLFIPEALRWITYIPFDINGRHLKSLYSIVSGRDIPMETQMVLPEGDVANGLAWGYVTNYLRKILPEVFKGIRPAFVEKGITHFRCPHKLFIVIPKSCSAGDFLNDKQNDPGRIENFSNTAAVYPFGPTQAFHCNIYKVSSSSFNMNEGLYFVGQYAAPVTCLQEMKTWNIAEVNLKSMASEAKRFYEIVSQLIRNAIPEKAQYCEFIYYDDITHSLADIMEQKIQGMKD